MSRSGYDDNYGDDDPWQLIRYRGMVASATRGRRGQKLLSDLVAALDAMPDKRLIAGDLIVDEPPCDTVRWLFAGRGYDDDDYDPRYRDSWRRSEGFEFRRDCGVCALGAVGLQRGLSMARLDPDDAETVGATFDIAVPLAREIVFENDEGGWNETPEQRWQRMRRWAVSLLSDGAPSRQDGTDERSTI